MTTYRGKILKDTSETAIMTDVNSRIGLKIAQDLGIKEWHDPVHSQIPQGSDRCAG